MSTPESDDNDILFGIGACVDSRHLKTTQVICMFRSWNGRWWWRREGEGGRGRKGGKGEGGIGGMEKGWGEEGRQGEDGRGEEGREGREKGGRGHEGRDE